MGKKLKIEYKEKEIEYHQNDIALNGSNGLPKNYPTPNVENLLFYIQRNLNENTVIYELNLDKDGFINMNDPITAYWIRYTDGGIKVPLNYVQEQLAYGYSYKEISPESLELQIVSYPKFRIFIAKNERGNYHAYARVSDEIIRMTNIYVYAEDFGVFPEVKYIDIHGQDKVTGENRFEKIIINN